MAIRNFDSHTPAIEHSVFIDPSALVIGNVRIGQDSSVWPSAIIRGDIHAIRIGARTNIQDGSIIHVTHDGPYHPGGFPTTIGDDVTVGHKVLLHGCVVQDRVLVGMGTIVMDGAIIEDEVIVGGGSLVPPGKRLESGYLYVGSPVRQIRKLTAEEIQFLAYSANSYVDLKNRHIKDLAHASPCQ
jgi:carbonic anhydrase/acetyltransferase-like protein (isoleucine patch superfamily)